MIGRGGDRHFVTDLDSTVKLVTETRCLLRAPLTDAVRSPAGCASVGMLMTLVDVGASDPAMVASRPDWTVTQDLALDGASWLTEGPIVLDSQLLRAGKKTVVVAATIYDGHGVEDIDRLQGMIDTSRAVVGERAPTLAASGIITFRRIPRSAAPGQDEYDPAKWLGQVRCTGLDSPATGTMYERLGLAVRDARAGSLELERSPYVINSVGTINGGVLAVFMEAAAEGVHPGMVATDMRIHYLSQVKTGPARTSALVLRDTADHSVVQVRVVDAGHGEQVLALSSVTLQPIPNAT